MSNLGRFLLWFFEHLYHDWAPAYGLVSWVVSFGRWNEWGAAALAGVRQGEHVLELGHGPGRLQERLRRELIWAAGIDESAAMGRLASRRLRGQPARLARALAQRLPFPRQSFDRLVSTFPSGYIIDPRTLSEAFRVLRPGGRLVIALSAEPAATSLPLRALRLLYRVTGESFGMRPELEQPFLRAGFSLSHTWVNTPGARIFVLTAERPESGALESANQFHVE